MTSRSAGLRWMGVIAALAVVAPGGAAGAADFTWSGQRPSHRWSDGGNWLEGTAPTGAVGTLTFPAFPVFCAACYEVDPDVAGVSANAVSIDDGYRRQDAGAGRPPQPRPDLSDAGRSAGP